MVFSKVFTKHCVFLSVVEVVAAAVVAEAAAVRHGAPQEIMTGATTEAMTEVMIVIMIVTTTESTGHTGGFFLVQYFTWL